jgi:AcrR family transcriptional regulator
MVVQARRKREREARRESILDAAESVALELGYSGLTMEAVATAAEIAKGTVYLYFSSKDALFAAIANRRISAMLPKLEAQLASDAMGRAKVASAGRFFAGHFIENPQHFRMMMGWLGSTDPLDTSSEEFALYRSTLGTLLSKVVDAVALGKGDGSITLEGTPSAIALAVWHGLVGILMARLAAPSLPQRVNFPLNFDDVLEVYLRGIDRMLDAAPRKGEAS